MILYILAISAITICQYTLDDEENGTKERIIMSKISEKKYLLAQFLTFFSLATIPVIEYYIICKVQNCDIQIENEIYFILLLLLSFFFSETLIIRGNIINNMVNFIYYKDSLLY